MDAVKEEIKALQKDGPSQKNFDKVKETLRRARESNLEKIDLVGSPWKHVKIQPHEYGRFKILELLDRLTLEEIHEMAKKCIDLKTCLATLKPGLRLVKSHKKASKVIIKKESNLTPLFILNLDYTES